MPFPDSGVLFLEKFMILSYHISTPQDLYFMNFLLFKIPLTVSRNVAKK